MHKQNICVPSIRTILIIKTVLIGVKSWPSPGSKVTTNIIRYIHRAVVYLMTFLLLPVYQTSLLNTSLLLNYPEYTAIN